MFFHLSLILSSSPNLLEFDLDDQDTQPTIMGILLNIADIISSY